MDSEKVTRLKAEAFDRIVRTYRELEQSGGFAMSSWVVLGEILESELKKIRAAEGESN